MPRLDRPLENGIQPIDKVLTDLGLKNSDLVENSTEQLTFKVVGKARKGRRITLNAQMKILNALNLTQDEKYFELKDLFNYKGKK